MIVYSINLIRELFQSAVKETNNKQRMGIRDAFQMDGIKRFFSNNAFVSKPQSRASIVRLISSSDRKKQIQGMRSVVSRMQSGEDMSDLYSDVIKTIDTRSVEFKRLLNLYLVRYTQGWPAKQLICINTLLKDFGDEVLGIRHSAIEDSGLLGDGTIVRNYVSPLKAHVGGPPETRRRIADSLKNYFRADPALFLDEGLGDILKDLAFDTNHRVCAAAAASLRIVERSTRILSAKEIKRLIHHYRGSGNTEALGSLLGIMGSRPEDAGDINLLTPLLRSCSLQIFYLASSLVLAASPQLKQLVFDCLRGFLDTRDEELFLVLDYAESLLQDVQYSNSCFVIYSDDKKYNKIKKLGLLFRRLDAISEAEIRRHSGDPEVAAAVLKEALQADHFVEGFFVGTSNADEVVRVLYCAESISARWLGAVQKFLECAEHVSEHQKYIYLCGRYASTIPKEMERILCVDIKLLVNEAARFYLNLHRRGVLTKEEALRHLGALQKNQAAKERVRMIVNRLKTGDVRLFDAFCSIKRNESLGGAPNALRTVSADPGSILDIKPYCLDEEASVAECMQTEDAVSSESLGGAVFQVPDDSKLRWLRFAESQKPSFGRGAGSMRLIDTDGLKGLLNIADENVVLQVDILEAPLDIHYECQGSLHSTRVETEGILPLLRVDRLSVNTEFRLTIRKSVYDLHLDIRNFIHLLEHSADEIERRFQASAAEIVLDRHILEGICTESPFGFSAFGLELYGRHTDAETALRGEREALKMFEIK